MLEGGRPHLVNRFLLPEKGLNRLELAGFLSVANDSQFFLPQVLNSQAEFDVLVPLDRSVELDEGVIELGVALARSIVSWWRAEICHITGISWLQFA